MTTKPFDSQLIWIWHQLTCKPIELQTPFSYRFFIFGNFHHCPVRWICYMILFDLLITVLYIHGPGSLLGSRGISTARRGLQLERGQFQDALSRASVRLCCKQQVQLTFTCSLSSHSAQNKENAAIQSADAAAKEKARDDAILKSLAIRVGLWLSFLTHALIGQGIVWRNQHGKKNTHRYFHGLLYHTLIVRAARQLVTRVPMPGCRCRGNGCQIQVFAGVELVIPLYRIHPDTTKHFAMIIIHVVIPSSFQIVKPKDTKSVVTTVGLLWFSQELQACTAQSVRSPSFQRQPRLWSSWFNESLV